MFKSKFDKWYDNQNDATKVFLDNQRKEDNKLIMLGVYLGFPVGSILTILIYSVL